MTTQQIRSRFQLFATYIYTPSGLQLQYRGAEEIEGRAYARFRTYATTEEHPGYEIDTLYVRPADFHDIREAVGIEEELLPDETQDDYEERMAIIRLDAEDRGREATISTEEEQPDTHHCEACGRKLEKDPVWLELSSTDGRYYYEIPVGHISQGAFPFGALCAEQAAAHQIEDEMRKLAAGQKHAKAEADLDLDAIEAAGREAIATELADDDIEIMAGLLLNSWEHYDEEEAVAVILAEVYTLTPEIVRQIVTAWYNNTDGDRIRCERIELHFWDFALKHGLAVPKVQCDFSAWSCDYSTNDGVYTIFDEATGDTRAKIFPARPTVSVRLWTPGKKGFQIRAAADFGEACVIVEEHLNQLVHNSRV